MADEQSSPAWKNPMAWLPHSIAEAALSGGDSNDVELAAAWAHLQERLTAAEKLVVSTPVNKNRVDYASGMRHLMVLLAVGIDMALRVDPDPVLAVNRAGMDDIVTWGLECPDCVYMNANLRTGETYRLFGNRGTARYVGLQTMDGITSIANALVDELEVDADGNFEAILSASKPQAHEGNWLRADRRPSDPDGAKLPLRLGHRGAWRSLQIERVGDEVATDGSLRRPGRLGITSAVRAGGVRLRQPQVLPRLRCDAAGQRLRATDGHVLDGCGRRKPARHRTIRTRARRSPDPRGRTAQGRLLEYLAGQPVVGDGPLRTPPVQPQRPPGGHRPRRVRAVRPLLYRSRSGELARCRRPQQRRDAAALRPNRNRPGSEYARGEGRRSRVGTAGRNHDDHPRRAGHGDRQHVAAPYTKGSTDELLRRRPRRRRARGHRLGRLRLELLPRGSRTHRRRR